MEETNTSEKLLVGWDVCVSGTRDPGGRLRTARFRSNLRLDRGKYVLFIGGENDETDEVEAA